MLPHEHALLGIVLAGIIFLLFPSVGILGATIIFASSILIDADHYFYYVYKKKKINPFVAYKWFTHKKERRKKITKEQKQKLHFGVYTLHGIEILLILFTLGFFVSNIFYFILVGFTFHLVVDLSVEILKYNDFDKISVIYAFCRSRGLTLWDDMSFT